MHGGNMSTGIATMDFWPEALNLGILHQHDAETNQSGRGFN